MWGLFLNNKDSLKNFEAFPEGWKMQIHGEGPTRLLKTLFDQKELVPDSSTATENMQISPS